MVVATVSAQVLDAQFTTADTLSANTFAVATPILLDASATTGAPSNNLLHFSLGKPSRLAGLGNRCGNALLISFQQATKTKACYRGPCTGEVAAPSDGFLLRDRRQLTCLLGDSGHRG